MSNHSLSPARDASTNSERDSTERAAEIWNSEYSRLRVIPSTTRLQPSKPLLASLAIAALESVHVVLDIWSGNERNAVWLAQAAIDVIALELSDAALELTRELVLRSQVEERVTTVKADLNEALPVRSSSVSLAVDSYVTCHFEPLWVQKTFKDEIARILASGGLLFSSQFARDDEYYAHLIATHGWDGQSVVDPANNVRKYLYGRDEVEELFGQPFKLTHLLELRFDDLVQGSLFRRHIFSILCTKD